MYECWDKRPGRKNPYKPRDKQNIPWDCEAFAEHFKLQEEYARRALVLPYIRLFCMEIAEKALVATGRGRIWDRGTSNYLSEDASFWLREDCREFLLSDECRDIWESMYAMGAYLWPYSRFREKLLRAIETGCPLMMTAKDIPMDFPIMFAEAQ
jgi:hypothetical protein